MALLAPRLHVPAYDFDSDTPWELALTAYSDSSCLHSKSHSVSRAARGNWPRDSPATCPLARCQSQGRKSDDAATGTRPRRRRGRSLAPRSPVNGGEEWIQQHAATSCRTVRERKNQPVASTRKFGFSPDAKEAPDPSTRTGVSIKRISGQRWPRGMRARNRGSGLTDDALQPGLVRNAR